MATKNINARIQHKIDTYYHWSLASNFRPLNGELIIFIPDDENDTRPIQMKVGNKNEDLLTDLDFITPEPINDIIEGSNDIVSGGAVYTALQNVNAISVNNLQFKVSDAAPEEETDDNVITFVV